MNEIRLGFGPRERRRILVRLAVVLAAGALLLPPEIEGRLGIAPAAAWTVVAAGLVAAGVKDAGRASEATLLTADGVVLAQWPSRKTLPWERITRIEARRRAGWLAGIPSMTAYAQLADGTAVRLPGLLHAPLGLTKPDFQEQLGVLLERWQQETSSTEAVLVTL